MSRLIVLKNPAIMRTTMLRDNRPILIRAVLFDFGGVLSEEGFREGLKEIGRKNGLDPDAFYREATELIHETGYVTGISDEKSYWRKLREQTGIKETDGELREEILKRFLIRPEMLRYVEKLKSSGYIVAILSDQTNWLDEINDTNPFYHRFDCVFNSYKVKKSKRDPLVFRDVCSNMGIRCGNALFIDDNLDNVMRASAAGMKTLHFTDVIDFGEK